MNPSIDRSAGFTLLEMLIAFLILSTALVVANQSVSSAVRAFSSSRDIRVADRLVNEILAESFYSGQGIMGERTGKSADGYMWRISQQPVSRGAVLGQASRVSVTIFNPRGQAVRTYFTYFPDKEKSNGSD